MASNLTNTSLIINGTQAVTGVSTVLNENNTELPTSAAFINYLIENGIWTPPPLYVGGIIFYIDNTADGTYTFKNAQGQVVSAPTVGADCTGWTYTVTGATKDKYYVYNPALVTDKYWGYYMIATSATDNSIGAGKTNTSKVLAITDTSQYASGSIWEYIRNMRTNRTNGCDDWFVGCPAEYNQLRSSGTTGASWFSSNDIWSSRVDSSILSFLWYKDTNSWEIARNRDQHCLIPIRAF